MQPIVPAAPATPISSPSPAVTVITQADLTTAVEAARKEEKDKLYGEIETLKAQNAKFSSDKLAVDQQLATLTQEHATLKATAETLVKAKKSDGTIDVQKLIEEVTDRVAKGAETSYSKTVTELQNQVSALNGQLKSRELKEVRERLIVDAGGVDSLIPELVQGNTEEEIKASVASSKAIFDRAKSRFSPNTAQPPAGTPSAPAPISQPATAPAIAPLPLIDAMAPIDPSAPAMRQVSSRQDPKQWASNRAATLQSLSGRYASASR